MEVGPHLRLCGGGERLRDWEEDDEKERERDRERDETEPEETERDGEREEEPEEEREAERPRRGFAIVPGGGGGRARGCGVGLGFCERVRRRNPAGLGAWGRDEVRVYGLRGGRVRLVVVLVGPTCRAP